MSSPAIVAPEIRDLSELAATLVSWLETKLCDASAVRLSNLSYPRGAGLSHETILFDADWLEGGISQHRGMVVRIKPRRDVVFLDDMFDVQYQLMQLMHDSGMVRVAKPLWIEHDASILGAPFFVMEKVLGRVAVTYPPYSREGWLFDSATADRRRMWEDAVRQLASIQRVPLSKAGFLSLPGNFAENFDQEVDRWRRYLDWIDPGAAITVLRDCFDKLRVTRPTNRAAGIVWGDARLGNMMIGADYRVTAVMDWEQPSLGGALHDLGWWLCTDHMQTVIQGIAPLDGMGTRAETISLWREVSGKSADDIDWYEALACFKLECLTVRTATIRQIPNGMSPKPGYLLNRFF